MKFGCCIGTTVEKAEVLAKAGFDFAELSVSSFTLMSDEEFDKMADGLQKAGIPCEAANCFVVGDIKLVGGQTEEKVIREYIEKALKRASVLGIKTIVFGSGGARRIPDGMTREEGVKDIVKFLREIAGPEAAKYGISIAIEPLCAKECNAINTVDQGIEIAKASGCENVKTLGDIYHMIRQDEPLGSLAWKKGEILHAHTSYPWCDSGKRRYPRSADTDFDQFDFMNGAYLSGCERFSLEAGCDDFAVDAPAALEVLKEAYAKVLAANK